MKKHPDTKRLDFLIPRRGQLLGGSKWFICCYSGNLFGEGTDAKTPRQAIDKAMKLK